MEKNKTPHSLMDIVDEARDLLDTRIDEIRFLNTEKISGEITPRIHIHQELAFLKDIRNLLVLSENFRV